MISVLTRWNPKSIIHVSKKRCLDNCMIDYDDFSEIVTICWVNIPHIKKIQPAFFSFFMF